MRCDAACPYTLSAPTSFRMKTLISMTLTGQLSAQSSSPNFLFHIPSLAWNNPKFLNFSHGRWLSTPKPLNLCSVTSSGSPSYGGWGDLRFGGDSVHSGEFNQLRKFLNSLRTDDKRYIFVYLLGFVCALAVSRVRVSSIVVFPVCVIVFAVGFSIGFVNGGHMIDLSLIGTKKRPKDDNFRVSIDKMRNLVDLFNGFDAKIVNLKNDIKRGIRSNQISTVELETYIKALESVELSALNARNIIEDCIDIILVENQELERNLNQKSSKRKKELVDGTGFDLLHFISGLFVENSIGSKSNKMKDLVKRELTNTVVNDHSQENILAPAVEERILSSVFNGNVGNGNVGFLRDSFNNAAEIQGRDEELIDGSRRIKAISESEKMNMARFMENERISLNVGHRNSVETWASRDGLLDLDFSVSLKHMRTEASFGKEQEFKNLNGNYRPSDSSEKSENETFSSRIREERDNDPSLANHRSAHEGDFASSPSSMVLDDMVFNRYLMEANILLKQARECLRHRGDEGDAENALYRSARLLSKAIDMKPMSLLAMGQLGNTYLLHGELKLKISRKLRTLLSRSDPLSVERAKVLKGLDDQGASKEQVASVLVNVCEECEELLVKAGRKYRLALSIDGNDTRALYNWGLALSFRGQLIADIGPEAALDADKVFLAAIDKFDAMMSKSNVYAPDALFRWGVALQQRSRLRTGNSKEKVKLLHQAKRLYEDALHMDSNNLQVRDALSSCISELNYRNY